MGLPIVVECVETGEQGFVDGAGAGHLSVVVEGLAEEARKMVQRHVAGADVEGYARAVGLFVGDVGEAAEVETGVVLSEKEAVANGHEGGSLSAHGYVEVSEVEDHREAGFGSDGIAVAYLCGKSERGLMEDGVAVGGYGVARAGVFLTETVDHLAKVVP